jgi:predicted nuclease of predicted toxin-antitoxin system
MKFIVDAQLPRRLALELTMAGYEALHTSDLPKGNQTSDGEIISLATAENRTVITKDEDFVNGFWLRGSPPKLLLISTGNISNENLSHLIQANLTALMAAISKHDFVELSAAAITIHV